MKRITVAIPTYNRKKYLIECLISVFNQTEKDLEIYIFDNCSNYDVEMAVRKIDPDKKVKIIKSDRNLGWLRNIQRVKNYNFNSKYLIAFQDDDTMHRDYLKSALDFLEKNEKVVWLGSNINFIKDDKRMFDFKNVNKNNFEKITTEKLITLLLKGFNLGFGSIIYKTKIYQNGANLEDLEKRFNKWADRPLFIELSKQGLVAITKEKFINSRVHIGQISQDNLLKEIPKEGYNLLEYYSTELDEAGFEKPNEYMTEQSIISATGSAQNFLQLFNLLKIFKGKCWFNYKKISFRGFYYLTRFFLKLLIKNIKRK